MVSLVTGCVSCKFITLRKLCICKFSVFLTCFCCYCLCDVVQVFNITKQLYMVLCWCGSVHRCFLHCGGVSIQSISWVHLILLCTYTMYEMLNMYLLRHLYELLKNVISALLIFFTIFLFSIILLKYRILFGASF